MMAEHIVTRYGRELIPSYRLEPYLDQGIHDLETVGQTYKYGI